MLKKITLFLLIALLLPAAFLQAKWGKTGHRVVGEIAANHLSKKATKGVKKILGHETLALSSTWADYIRSEPQKYAYTFPWHYVNIPDTKNYQNTTPNPEGDIVQAIALCIKKLKNREKISIDSQRFYLRFLVHFVGDIHQPLHVGRKKDKGGNDIKVKWFGKDTNLHAVWDSKIIDYFKLSYTELAQSLDHAHVIKKQVWQNKDISQWVEEGLILRKIVYESASEHDKLFYRYTYDHGNTVKKQLLKAGLRLSEILNQVFR